MDFLNPVSNPAGFTLFIVGFTTLTVVASFVWRAKWSGRGLRHRRHEGGTSGTAVITGMGQSGMYINELPQLAFDLLVQLPGGRRTRPRSARRSPHVALGMLAPGADGGRRRRPEPAVEGQARPPGHRQPGGDGRWCRGADRRRAAGPLERRPRRHRRAGRRHGVSPRTAGQFHGLDPIVVLTVDVHHPAGPYQIQVGHRIPADKRALVQPGVVLRATSTPSSEAPWASTGEPSPSSGG